MTGTKCEHCGYVAENRGMDCIYSVLGLLLCPDCMYLALHAIERLRSEEGHAVTLNCDNPDPPPASAVDVIGHWTDWQEKRLEGSNIFAALLSAEQELDRLEMDGE